MGILVYSLLWVMQDLYHQSYYSYQTHVTPFWGSLYGGFRGLGFRV